MDLKNRLIRYINNYYILNNINSNGTLTSYKLGSDEIIEIDPLVNYCEILDIWVLNKLKISGSSLSNLLYLVGKPIRACVAYKNKRDEILVLFGCKDKTYFLYKLSDRGETVHIASVRGNISTPGGQDYVDVCRLSGFNLSFTLDMYELSNPLVGISCYNILKGLLSYGNKDSSIDISFLSTLDSKKEYELIYVKDSNSHFHIFPVKDLSGYLTKEKVKKLSRKDISDYVKSFYKYPCIHFSDEELVKVSSIFSQHGYPINSILKKYNGRASNFYISSKNFSLAICDVQGTSSYEVRKLVCYPVKSYKGHILYYELRSYPLDEESFEYRVLSSSIHRGYIMSLIKGYYADLIRSSRVHYSGSIYYLDYFSDERDFIRISCYNPSTPDVKYSSVFSKINKKWAAHYEEIPFSARDFMSKMIYYFDERYGILS